MSHLAVMIANVVAILILVFGIFFPRHRRRDLIVAYLGVNVGVMAVAATLATVDVGVGVGFGLFGVLSIIRLRSTELDQQEVAYYFAALALGLLGGLGVDDPRISVALMAVIVAVLYIGDHPKLLGGYTTGLVMLDRAFPDHAALVSHLEGLLGAQVRKATVKKLDLVTDTTLVEVQYETGRTAAAGAPALENLESYR
ncbi:MAG: DUF4956 domain-containing protein [Candidatus Nanopelagicales bacterium]